MRKKEHHPICHFGKMHDDRMLFKPPSIKDYKDSHQFSFKILDLRVLDVKHAGKRFEGVYDPACINLKASFRREEE